MNLFKNKEQNFIDEFIKGDEREVRKKCGKYHVFEVDKKSEELLQEILISNATNGNDNIVINSENDYMKKLLKAFTDLPEKIYEDNNYDNVVKNNPKKFFVDICDEIVIIFLEYVRDFSKKVEVTASMSDGMKDALNKTIENRQKEIDAIEEKLEKFSPRAWVLENMTDKVCAGLMLEIIKKSIS